jgi:flagellar protein FliO/FliZ
MNAAAPAVSPLSVGSLTQLGSSLLAIVALILAIGWMLKRFKLAVPRPASDIAVLDELSVGPRERIALIRVGDAQVLIGIGAAGIVPLIPLATPIAVRTDAAAPAFASRLRELIRRPGGTA